MSPAKPLTGQIRPAVPLQHRQQSAYGLTFHQDELCHTLSLQHFPFAILDPTRFLCSASVFATLEQERDYEPAPLHDHDFDLF